MKAPSLRAWITATTGQQTSLMNTDIHMTDIAPAPDSRSLFMATYSEFGPESVWRSAGEPLGTYWGRLLNIPSKYGQNHSQVKPELCNRLHPVCS